MIQLKRVNKYYNRFKKNQIHVINDTTLSLEQTGLVAILGESGCGKTTLLNAIGGLDKVSSGHIYVNGKKMNGLFTSSTDRIRNLNIGYIFQDYHLIDHLSVFDNVAIALKMVGIKNKKEIKDRVDYVLEAVNMYRYRNRLASNLSGGERQRVGIARALVKNPKIIIADEPTGNLDSKNTIEIMNIIKGISQTKLVILVTHEKNLAYFYASRIIELSDGKVINDYINNHENKLDYRMDNKMYLKDFSNHKQVTEGQLSIDFYGEDEPLKLQLVVQNGNLYVKTDGIKKVELVDNHSAIEFVDDHYQMISKDDYLKDTLDMDKIMHNKKLRYASIVNPISCFIQGFKRVHGYSAIKKVLLIGFCFAAMAMLFATSRIFGAYNYQDKDFIDTPHNYLLVNAMSVSLDDYDNYQSLEGVQYVVPSNGKVTLNIPFDYYYQTYNVFDQLHGTLVDVKTITENELIYGRMPENTREIVVDAFAIERMYNANHIAIQVGLKDVEDMLGVQIDVPKIGTLTIVGIVSKSSPGIYMEQSMFTNMLLYAKNEDYYFGATVGTETVEPSMIQCTDYQLYVDSGSITLKKGRYPKNAYEVIIPYDQREVYKINKTVPYKVNNTKLKVVGYYTTAKGIDEYLVSNQTVTFDLITKTANVSIYTTEKEYVMDQLHGMNVNVADPYYVAKEKFLQNRKEGMTSTLVISGIMIGISLIEIFLMLRSSFLSRVKEVGVYRAIGVKRFDIYQMFLGEILAITFVSSIVGFVFMGYIIDALSKMPYIGTGYVLNIHVFVISVILYYVFNIVVGLYPLYRTLRKTPASILSRNDVD